MNEQLGKEGPGSLLTLLREAISIPDGVSIATWAHSQGLDKDYGFWVNTAIVAIVRKFVGCNGSPFEDAIQWKKLSDTVSFARRRQTSTPLTESF